MTKSHLWLHPVTKYTLLKTVLIVLTFFIAENSKAQLSVMAGGNYCNIRSNIHLQSKEPIIRYMLGLSFQYHPLKKYSKLSVLNELSYNQKGYLQNFETKYPFKFNYLSFPMLVEHSLLQHLSVQGGIEPSILISTNINQGLKTYNNFDLGLLLGMNYRCQQSFNLFTRLSYGVIPILDYYEIDDLGNFKSKIHDLKNICLTIGIKINLSNEKTSSSE